LKISDLQNSGKTNSCSKFKTINSIPILHIGFNYTLKIQDPFPVARKEVLRVLKGLQIASSSMANIGSLHNDVRTILFLYRLGCRRKRFV